MQSYTEPLPMADKILELFTAQRPAGYDHKDFLQIFGYGHQTPEAGYVLSALHLLVNDDLLELYGHSNNLYKVTGTTFTFKDSGGYKKKIERENELEQAKTIGEQMAVKSAQSVIDTNTSIQALNRNTTTFYDKQSNFNKWQKRLTFAILISTAAYTVISYFMLRNQNTQLDQEKTKSTEQVKHIKNQILEDSVFLKNLKKSLK
jgi:hypothetical protein